VSVAWQAASRRLARKATDPKVFVKKGLHVKREGILGWLLGAIGLCLIAFAALPALAGAAPPIMEAYYMSASTLSGLRSAAYDAGCSFAHHNPGGYRVLMLDFGAARNVGSNEGAEDFAPHLFSNHDIQKALKSASDGANHCHNGHGTNVIAYGNSNWHMGSCSDGGCMSERQVYNVGYDQTYSANLLWNYERDKGRTSQGVAAGSDVELSWDGPDRTNQLIHGASAYGHSLYYDYGDAAGCPPYGSCTNGWSVADVEFASFGGVAVPMPEIYYSANADEWTNIRKSWDKGHSRSYQFWGVTGTTGVGLTPTAGWSHLSAQNPGLVDSQPGTFCFGC
jgi:hypothetical protein